MTLGMAFSGQVLRFDQDAYWGLGIGASIASRVPIIGPLVVKLMLGGPIIAGATLSRFFALHVFVIPGLLIGFVGLHVLMVLKLGINEWPMPGRIVRRATYEAEYHALTKSEGAPVRAICGLERPVFRGIYHPGNCRLRLLLWPILGRRDSPIRPSSRLRRNQITFSCGSMLCFHFFLHRLRRRSFSSARP